MTWRNACLLCIIWIISGFVIQGQDSSPSIPVTLADPYIILIPIGWEAEISDGFGFTRIHGEGLTLSILDPNRLGRYIPFDENTSPRRLISDYYHFFFGEELQSQAIQLGLIDEREYAIYQSRETPKEATIIIKLKNGLFGLVELRADNGDLSEEDISRTLTVIQTISLASSETQASPIAYETQILPSKLHSLSLPLGWIIEPSAAPGQLFIVGDDMEIIVYPPDSIAGYFQFPENVDLIDLAHLIEATLFDTQLGNTRIDSARAGDRQLVAYGFRNVNLGIDTQVVLIALPNGEIGYFRAISLPNSFTPEQLDQVSSVALSLQRLLQASQPEFPLRIEEHIIPNSGSWRVHLRPLMRQACDGQAEQLIPIPQTFQYLSQDYFETILLNPDGSTLTLTTENIAALFQGKNLQGNESGDYLVESGNALFFVHPLTPQYLRARLNITQSNVNNTGKTCRVGLNFVMKWVE